MGCATLKGIAGNRKNMISKLALLALVGFTMDAQPDSDIKPSMRDLKEFIPKLQAVYHSEGRMASDLQMPPPLPRLVAAWRFFHQTDEEQAGRHPPEGYEHGQAVAGEGAQEFQEHRRYIHRP